jgi:hypothetical protein
VVSWASVADGWGWHDVVSRVQQAAVVAAASAMDSDAFFILFVVQKGCCLCGLLECKFKEFRTKAQRNGLIISIEVRIFPVLFGRMEKNA